MNVLALHDNRNAVMTECLLVNAMLCYSRQDLHSLVQTVHRSALACLGGIIITLPTVPKSMQRRHQRCVHSKVNQTVRVNLTTLQLQQISKIWKKKCCWAMLSKKGLRSAQAAGAALVTTVCTLTLTYVSLTVYHSADIDFSLSPSC